MNALVLRRRLFYICAMVVMLVPLYFLGNPSVRLRDGSVRDQGGTLAQLRTHYDLGQSDLGEMDPASESMRLATLGLRGVASTILWQKAEFYKKEKYWDRLSATLNQIAILQPHFVKVWEFQAHNMSYNVSVEFDDYRQRYQWVKRGISYLIKGGKFNKRRTELPYELGWFFGNKMGVADEKEQFRELFRNDENYHREVEESSGMDLTQARGLGPDSKPDNWRSGMLWYDRAYAMVEAGSRAARSTMNFYRMGPQWQMKHAEGIQSEGYLDEDARLAWEVAEREWKDFGQRLIKTTYGDTIYLAELERANEQYAEDRAEFEEFCGEVYERSAAEKRALLSPEQAAALDKPAIERSYPELLLAEEAEGIIKADTRAVAIAMPEDKRLEAIRLADDLYRSSAHIRHIEVYRNQINFPYWDARCVAEQEDAALLARTSMYEANELLDNGDLDRALEKFEVAWTAWSDLFNKHPAMMVDDLADSIIASVERYRRLLDQPDLPEDFPLASFLKFREDYDAELGDPALMSVISAWPKRYPGRDFLTDILAKNKQFKKDLADRKAELAEEAGDESAETTPPDLLTPLEDGRARSLEAPAFLLDEETPAEGDGRAEPPAAEKEPTPPAAEEAATTSTQAASTLPVVAPPVAAPAAGIAPSPKKPN